MDFLVKKKIGSELELKTFVRGVRGKGSRDLMRSGFQLNFFISIPRKDLGTRTE